MSETSYGTFDELLSITVDEMKPIALQLRALVLDVHPDAVEVVRLGDRAATYGVGPRKNFEGHTYILPHRQWVNLGLLRGTQLADPDGLMEGTGATMRHVKVRAVDEVQRPALRALIEAALAERRQALDVG